MHYQCSCKDYCMFHEFVAHLLHYQIPFHFLYNHHLNHDNIRMDYNGKDLEVSIVHLRRKPQSMSWKEYFLVLLKKQKEIIVLNY